MIVVDASAVLELLLRTEVGRRVEARVLTAEEQMNAPHSLDIEITQALRRLTQLKSITASRGSEALADYRALAIRRAGTSISCNVYGICARASLRTMPPMLLLPRAWASLS